MIESARKPRGVGKPDVSIVIPVYNEDQMIEPVLRAILRVEFGGYSREIIVVNDGSSDRTREILKGFHDTPDLQIIHRAVNTGKGAAVRDGIAAATGKVIIIQDSDLEYDPTQIPILVEPILTGRTKVVYGSRFKGSIRNMSPLRRLANRVLTRYLNVLFRSEISDACTCYKAVDGDLIRSFALRSSGFEVCHEITAYILRARQNILELPISYCARAMGEGVKSSWKDFIKQLWYISYFRFRRLNGSGTT